MSARVTKSGVRFVCDFTSAAGGDCGEVADQAFRFADSVSYSCLRHRRAYGAPMWEKLGDPSELLVRGIMES